MALFFIIFFLFFFFQAEDGIRDLYVTGVQTCALPISAELVTPELINFMATHARGLICLAMDDKMIDRLELPMMVRDNQASLGTAFTVSIEARHGVSTGISARDRATTIRAAIADDASPRDVVSPGHIFPLRARK